MAEHDLKRTPLYETHVRAGGKMVPFAGWEMPVQYPDGIIAEHMAVRTACGLFDVSHMGEIRVSGPDALRSLNHLMTNDFTDLADNGARYTLMCNDAGGIVDDLIVYKKDDQDYLLVVNAGTKDKDYAWILEHQSGDVTFEDVSAEWGQVALQGPKAGQILRSLTEESQIPQKYYTCLFDRSIRGIPCMISATGYTGEDGFEIYVPAERTAELWDLLMEAGKESGLIPCGLGARDTLRLEAGMPLYGNDMDETVTPREAGLGNFVRMDKPDFIGKAALETAGSPKRVKVGLRVTGRGILREHMDVFRNGKKIGITTSGTKCPYIGQAVAFARIDADAREYGETVEVDVRGRRVEAEMTKSRFYTKGL